MGANQIKIQDCFFDGDGIQGNTITIPPAMRLLRFTNILVKNAHKTIVLDVSHKNWGCANH
jgi:hypothetical protein